MDATVSEIHGYPLRPPGFEEPLFPTRESRRIVAEHLARSGWLVKASELAKGRSTFSGESASRRGERVRVVRTGDGRACLVRGCGRRGTRKRKIERVLDRWRVVTGWCSGEGAVDRLLYRVELAGGAVVDLARDRVAGEWLVVGVVD